MFERYTESATRALFFARYEVTQLGGAEIATQHVLLGLMHESRGLVRRILALSQISPESIRKEIEERAPQSSEAQGLAERIRQVLDDLRRDLAG